MRFLCLAFILAVISCGTEREGKVDATVSKESPPPNAFSGDSALAHVAKQVGFGPRVPGTGEHRRAGRWLQETLEGYGARVTTQEFTYTDSQGKDWPLTNILGAFGTTGKPLLLVAHWDTRPWADQDPEPRNHGLPIPGANDGGSGVAVLLEVARHLEGIPLPRSVHLLLVDGEDIGLPEVPGSFCQGSRYFAQHLSTEYDRAIVLDMVGDVNLLIPIEYHSANAAPEVVNWVWSRAEAVAPRFFSRRVQGAIMDDHVPLLEAGIPAVDLIDFDYWAWHTTQDDLPQVSSRSLEGVGQVILSLVLDP